MSDVLLVAGVGVMLALFHAVWALVWLARRRLD